LKRRFKNLGFGGTVERWLKMESLKSLRKKVQKLLKQIDRMWNKAHDRQIQDSKVFSWYDGYKQACEDLELKIRKAFSGVIEE